MTPPMQPDPEKLAYRIDEAVKASGLGRSFLYERMADGSLKSVKIGGRRLILRDDLIGYLRREANTKAPIEKQASNPPNKAIRGQLELPLK